MINLDEHVHKNPCFTTNKEDLVWLWHHRLGHASYNILHKLKNSKWLEGYLKFDSKLTIKSVSPMYKENK